MIQRFTAVMALATVAAACGGAEDTTPLSLQGYVDEVNEIVVDFDAESEAADQFDSLPAGGQLANAAISYMAYEGGLDAMRRITPPESITEEHERVVARLTEVQDVVGEYLDKATRDPNSFTFFGLNNDPAVAPRLTAFEMACDDLRSALQSYDVTGIPNACGLLGP